MHKPANFPVEGKSIRFAPSRDQEQPAANFWKFWAEGNEIYAVSRSSAGFARISVHESGQIHSRLAAKLKQDMAPLMPMPSGTWHHALEVRFLLSEGARLPINQLESLKKKLGYIIQVPAGSFLCANLIAGQTNAPFDHPLPIEFSGGQVLWRTRLRDRRPALLVARVLKLDDQNREHIRYLREELKPTVTTTTTSTSTYVEIHRSIWSAGGNIILVVPMGEEALRSEQDFVQSDIARRFHFRSFGSKADLIAPNGLTVATLEMTEVDKEVELMKGLPKTVELGFFSMRIDPGKLTPGSPFIAFPVKLPHSPHIGGASFRTWEYMIHARFDGSCLSVEIPKISGSLRNKNFSAPVAGLSNTEEITVTIPSDSLKLSATLDVPFTSTEILGRLTLLDS